MLEMFKGQLDRKTIDSMTLKELLSLRDIRIKRYEKERKDIEDEQRARESEASKERAELERQQRMNMIKSR